VNRIKPFAIFLGILLIPLHAALSQPGLSPVTRLHGAVVRGDTSQPELALVFTGDEYADGAILIRDILKKQDVKASFFLTGKFYRNPDFQKMIESLNSDGHYLGAHSGQHLLYCAWENRDSLLVTQKEFTEDLRQNYHDMLAFGIAPEDACYFLPPFEWYNDSIAAWTRSMGFHLINLTYGTLSHVDYTVPGTTGYRGSREIYQSILDYESSSSSGLNGFILLVHIGTVPERTDKFYLYLERLIPELRSRGYHLKRIDELLDCLSEQSK
jgi:peptidoglycan/xylan/chitin deacetylase (PgdA/CDA1 family)